MLIFPGLALGMEFKIYYRTQLELKMVIGEGKIQEGDAEKFLAVPKMADRDEEGLVVLVLNSREETSRQLSASSMRWIRYGSIQRFQIMPNARPLALRSCSLQENAEVMSAPRCSFSLLPARWANLRRGFALQ
ncbi:hypothetical protein BUPH_08327 (plasmid) [Paraburkholderia phenoliruptrix BR3459a]|uniref:Uncharacterized protein n=1 Tax=Paraburkholderia phenoliruptrix BR3459a TaxID=1229205 RepID=K0DUS2_9BURK|nr:hypothetical protein BUPH_08327 [Paraburkholderia phenoliruptrix BR3459a]